MKRGAGENAGLRVDRCVIHRSTKYMDIRDELKETTSVHTQTPTVFSLCARSLVFLSCQTRPIHEASFL